MSFVIQFKEINSDKSECLSYNQGIGFPVSSPDDATRYASKEEAETFAKKNLSGNWEVIHDPGRKMLAIFHMEDSGPYQLVVTEVTSTKHQDVAEAFQKQCEIEVRDGTEILIVRGTEVVEQFFLGAKE